MRKEDREGKKRNEEKLKKTREGRSQKGRKKNEGGRRGELVGIPNGGIGSCPLFLI